LRSQEPKECARCRKERRWRRGSKEIVRPREAGKVNRAQARHGGQEARRRSCVAYHAGDYHRGIEHRSDFQRRAVEKRRNGKPGNVVADVEGPEKRAGPPAAGRARIGVRLGEWPNARMGSVWPRDTPSSARNRRPTPVEFPTSHNGTSGESTRFHLFHQCVN